MCDIVNTRFVLTGPASEIQRFDRHFFDLTMKLAFDPETGFAAMAPKAIPVENSIDMAELDFCTPRRLPDAFMSALVTHFPSVEGSITEGDARTHVYRAGAIKTGTFSWEKAGTLDEEKAKFLRVCWVENPGA
jgi:hypothetical protein